MNPTGNVATETIPTTVGTTTDPWMLFLYALKAPATKEKYIQRLTKFLDFLGYQGTKEEKARAIAARAKADLNYGFNSVLKFFQVKREQIDRKETAIGTVRNYAKSIKLFCDMADLQIPRAKITRGLPREKRFADDRAPTLQYLSNVALTADHGFIRFHGRNKGYSYNCSYDEQELKPWVSKVNKIRKDPEAKRLRIYFNNHYWAKAVANALEFKEIH